MKGLNLLFYHNNRFSIIGVVLPSSDKVTYFKTLAAFSVGDAAVVESEAGFSIAHVVEVGCFAALEKANAWVVQRVDLARYQRAKVVEETVTSILQAAGLDLLRDKFTEGLITNLGEAAVDALIEKIAELG